MTTDPIRDCSSQRCNADKCNEEKGIKQTWLAEQLGKSYNMVNSYVQNRQQPRLEILNEIAKILDVDVVELIVSSKKK